MKFQNARKILVGVESEGRSDEAIVAACKIAGHGDRKVHLLHATNAPSHIWVGMDPADFDAIRHQMVERSGLRIAAGLEGLERQRELKPGSLSKALEILPGPPARTIVERAESYGADVVFLGTHAKRSLLEFGNTIRTLFHTIPCALWIQPCEALDLKRVLVPIDLSPASLEAAGQALEFAKSLELPVDLLHVFSDPQMFAAEAGASFEGWPQYTVDGMRAAAQSGFDKAVKELGDLGAGCNKIFVEGSPPTEILARQEPSVLTVMATHGHTGLARLVFGSVSYNVFKEAKGPVLGLRT